MTDPPSRMAKLLHHPTAVMRVRQWNWRLMQRQVSGSRLDLAAALTLQSDGTVYGVKPEKVPGEQLLAAVYRY